MLCLSIAAEGELEKLTCTTAVNRGTLFEGTRCKDLLLEVGVGSGWVVAVQLLQVHYMRRISCVALLTASRSRNSAKPALPLAARNKRSAEAARPVHDSMMTYDDCTPSLLDTCF